MPPPFILHDLEPNYTRLRVFTVAGQTENPLEILSQASGLLWSIGASGAAALSSGVFTAPDAATVPLTVIGASGQTADLIQLKNSGGTVLSGFDAAGRLGVGVAPVSTQRLTVVGSTASNKVAVLKVAASQTGSALEVQDSGGTARVIAGDLTQTASHTLTLRAITSQSGALLRALDAAGTTTIFFMSPAGAMTVGGASAPTSGTQLRLYRATSGASMEFAMDNSAAAAVGYSLIDNIIVANTAGAESGTLRIWTRNAGTLTTWLTISNAGVFTLMDGANIAVGTTTGTRIGTTAAQKLGFFNATPIVQPANTTDLRAAIINLGLLASGGVTPLDLNGGALTIGSAMIADGGNVALGTTTGTKIGTVGGAAGQKLGFFAATPIVQPLLATGGGATVDQVITALQNLGLVRQS